MNTCKKKNKANNQLTYQQYNQHIKIEQNRQTLNMSGNQNTISCDLNLTVKNNS